MPKRPRWSDEEWQLRLPDSEKVVCKSCFHRAPDAGNIKGCTKSICKAYPVTKPHAVLWENASCIYYLDENDEE